MTLPPLPDPLVMVNRYGQGASTSDGDGGVFTAAQMIAYATAAVLAEREACAKLCADRFVGDDEAKDDECRACAYVIRERSAV